MLHSFRSVLLSFLLVPFALAQEAPPAAPAEPAAQPATPALPLGGVAKKAQDPAAKPVYDEAADAKKDVAAALERAKRENKRVLIQWGANWCSWCKWLAGTMKKDAQLSRAILYEYEVVHVDVGRFDKHMDLAKELGAEFKAIPYLTVLDADGKTLVQQNTEPFEAKVDGKDGHDAKKILAFLVQHQAKPLEAEAVVKAAMETAKAEHKRVFLHFGAPWCGWCHRLEDWMRRPEIAALLQKDFVDCKVDADRMVGGQAMLDARRKEVAVDGGGIPWFAFLDADGKVLAHSNGPKGNTGFPYQPEEVEHFVTMLNAARQNLTEQDVAALRTSLDENRKQKEGR